MLELTVAATVFALALLSTGLTLLHGVRSQEESTVFSDSLRAVRSIFAEVQQIANQPADLSTIQGISAVYTLYDGQTRAIPELPNGTATITVYANETLVPAALGGPQDLNFDGDANDDHGGMADGSDLQLIPMELTISFTDERGTVTRTFYRSFSQSTD